MRSIDEVIEASIDQQVAEKSSWGESMVRPYLPEFAQRILDDLRAEGYDIVVKPKPAPPKPHPTPEPPVPHKPGR